MEEMSGIICALAAELYKQVLTRTDNSVVELESLSISAENEDGYNYKVTISREGAYDEE